MCIHAYLLSNCGISTVKFVYVYTCISTVELWNFYNKVCVCVYMHIYYRTVEFVQWSLCMCIHAYLLSNCGISTVKFVYSYNYISFDELGSFCYILIEKLNLLPLLEPWKSLQNSLFICNKIVDMHNDSIITMKGWRTTLLFRELFVVRPRF